MLQPAAALAQSAPQLGTAGSFAVLGGSAVTSSGATKVTGNVGVSPGTTVTLPDSAVSLGKIYRDNDGDGVARQAQRDNAAAYSDLTTRPCNTTSTTFTASPAPGVHCLSSSAQLGGMLTLDGHGDANAVWIFKITGTLTTDAKSAVLLTGGAISSNVFWQVADSATLGDHSTFIGSILALNNITVQSGVTMSGRLLAQRGVVTLDSDEITLCCDPITLSPPTLPDGKVGIPYRVAITAEGGCTPHTFTVAVGSLPPGLTLSSDGVLSGLPTTLGRYPFTVMATDRCGCSGIRAYEILICPIITLSPPVLPPPPGCIVYDQQITATGGSPRYVFSVAPEALPQGVTLSQDGLLSGTPATSACSTFTATATDMAGCTGNREYTVCGLFTLPDGTVGNPYSADLARAGISSPFTCSVTCGVFPQGLSLTNCTISGTPTKEGVYLFTITAVDTLGTAVNWPYQVTISCPAITLQPLVPDSGVVGQPFNATIKVDPPGDYVFALVPNAPEAFPGVILSDKGVLSGTPTAEGAFKFFVIATGANLCKSNPKQYEVTISCPFITLSPASSTLPPAVLGMGYSQQITANGGTMPYTFTKSGSLPDGLELSTGGPTAGLISGTPTQTAISSKFTVMVTDFYSCPSRPETYVICLPITIDQPPNATADTPYKVQLVAHGGAGSFTFAPVGQVTTWLLLSSNGELAGTPATAGSYTFIVTATDGPTGCSGTTTLTIEVSGSGCGGVTITPASTLLPDATVGVGYGQLFLPSGGTPPYTFVAPFGAYPPGLSLSVGGLLSGVPTTPGRFNFPIKSTDSKGAFNCDQVYTINVGPLPPAPPDIPALSRWGLLMSFLFFAFIGFAVLRKPGGWS